MTDAAPRDDAALLRRRAVSVLTLCGLLAGDAHAGSGRGGEISQLAAATADGLLRGYVRLRSGKQPDPQDMMRRSYMQWAALQGVSVLPDADEWGPPAGWLATQAFMREHAPRGQTTRHALAAFLPGRPVVANTSKGSACVPRAAACGALDPGITAVGDTRALIALGAQSAAITHGHPAAHAAAGALAGILGLIANGESLSGAVLRTADIMRFEQDAVQDQAAVTAVTQNLQVAIDRTHGGGEYTNASQFGWNGYVAEEALGIAVWAALRRDPAEVFTLAGGHSGERHATTATAGALWGAEAGRRHAEATYLDGGAWPLPGVAQPLDELPAAARPAPDQLSVMEWIAEDLARICVNGSTLTPADRTRWPGW